MNLLLIATLLIGTLVQSPDNPFPKNEVKIAKGDSRLVDKRLLGKWISDKEKTVNHCRFKEGATIEQRAKVSELFGKLKIEFRENEMITEFEGKTESEPYSVIAFDNDSVAIVANDFNGQKISHIHFEKDSYYVHIGYSIEFFKRIH